MKRLLQHGRWGFQSLAMLAILCSATPGFTENESSTSDDQVPAETATTTDDASTNTETPVADPLEPDASANQSHTNTAPVQDNADPSITLKGQIWRTKPGIVFLKTPVGLLSLSSKTTLKDLLASQEVFFWIHDAHLAIDIRKRSDNSLVHRYLGGPLKPRKGDEHTLLRWTPKGEQSFNAGAHSRSLTALQEDKPVTVEVDEAGTVIGIHDLQFDLQIGQIPPDGSDTHLVLTGTVAKMKSNFVFLRTPVGVVNVNTKIGIKNARVGQTLTLRIHGRDVVVDLVASN